MRFGGREESKRMPAVTFRFNGSVLGGNVSGNGRVSSLLSSDNFGKMRSRSLETGIHGYEGQFGSDNA
ncbi:hypothetical protein OESDEN_09313 [Oesophagostomum dentatum]|uniref:Uncharacterized protein n=1 Tax=Oesophagostomum dentatum TaxID=61180 RepID=A0A0B1SZW7_OESDE|nr:hypothetical protein OESDEN_09313 [Oesophagostomum dentatum]